MKILIIGSRSFPPGIGGIERYVYEFSKAASKMGHDITVIVQRREGEKKYERFGNVEVIRCYATSVKPLDRLFMYFQTILNKKGEYDVYWGHGTVGDLLHRWKPYVYTKHGFTSLRGDRNVVSNWILKKLEFSVLDKADMVTAVDLKSYKIVKKYNPETYLMENGIDVDRFSEEYDNPYDGSRNVLFVGRLVESKGVIDIMDAVEGMKKVCLHMVGSGPLEGEIKSRESENIVFHGKVDKVEGYFQHADAFVLPSYHEGFPTTVLEAMAAKTPCIMTDLPAFKGNFSHGRDCLLFEPGDVEAMQKYIKMTLEDDKLAKHLTQRAYNKVKREYSWEAKTKEILQLFEELIDKRQN